MKNSNSLARIIILGGLLCASLFFGWQSFEGEQRKLTIKSDLVELLDIQYGLFNVDVWKDLSAEILSKKIESFNLTEPKRGEVKKEIESFAYRMIDDFEKTYHQENSKSIGGFLKVGVASMTGTFSEMRKFVPTLSSEILAFFNETKNRSALKKFLKAKMDTYTKETFSEVDYSKVLTIQNKLGVTTLEEAKLASRQLLADLDDELSVPRWLTLICALLACAFLLWVPILSTVETLLISAFASTFLFLGIFLPMIEIDARISEMKFNLLGEPLEFLDQVLFYKCKSIINVVEVMLSQGKIDLFFVGSLVLTFSVLFPLSKLISIVFYATSDRLKNNPVINWFVFKTGKWSMADVMVVAIFMAFIGFSGILSEQLGQIENIAPNLKILTTNESHLEFGFYTFTAFVLISMLCSGKLKKQAK
ncbi:MAG: hypothetical protein ACI9YL_001671 [Luteibaculaceae bacterium]|jgi:hypothetical protein